MARELKVYAPDRTTPVLSMPASSGTELTAEDIRRIVVSMGFTACETADFTDTTVGSNGREVRFKRVTGGTKGAKN